MKPGRIVYVPGNYYHIYNRGAHRAPIIRQKANYRFLIQRMKMYSLKYKINIVAFCLLPNHYHFLLRQDGRKRAGLLPQHLFNVYTKAYNKRYNHSGTLFQGSFKVKWVDSQDYLLHLCRYIHANPVLHGLVRKPQDWPWSDYAEWAGLRSRTGGDGEFVNAHFPAPGAYAAFVDDYVQTRQVPRSIGRYLEEWGA